MYKRLKENQAPAEQRMMFMGQKSQMRLARLITYVTIF